MEVADASTDQMDADTTGRHYQVCTTIKCLMIRLRMKVEKSLCEASEVYGFITETLIFTVTHFMSKRISDVHLSVLNLAGLETSKQWVR